MPKAFLPFKAYSFAEDATVPRFDDSRPLVVYDGVCILCSGFIKFVLKHDHAQKFHFTAAQSPLGQALFQHYRLDPVNFETNLLVYNGQAYARLDAFTTIMSLLPLPVRLLSLARFIPSPLDRWFYESIAKNRYRIFGRSESCMVPTPDIRKRFID
ncbi:DCC1-like thiol-disulfide oxidoreductase family protein [Kiloniella laminariae]|uniref:DCC1-like thiol-disulfide oxidoreductase family protein n=1 Tax=Kiloniella laminariae TaxID=454162 RepID=A0ABT4LDK3_9PROT|nr:DCC1-like thiol-disulfide oxidoreductase family protein [Kiloniella laminariae]MCZ4279159.1 DCC1-like thiol-disulfide oxidoreductase family protein [Kiloniella laminariae]